jgi:hypothetical protein
MTDFTDDDIKGELIRAKQAISNESDYYEIQPWILDKLCQELLDARTRIAELEKQLSEITTQH